MTVIITDYINSYINAIEVRFYYSSEVNELDVIGTAITWVRHV